VGSAVAATPAGTASTGCSQGRGVIAITTGAAVAAVRDAAGATVSAGHATVTADTGRATITAQSDDQARISAVTATATIKEIDGRRKRVVLDTVCTVQGKAVIEGEATVMFPARPA